MLDRIDKQGCGNSLKFLIKTNRKNEKINRGIEWHNKRHQWWILKIVKIVWRRKIWGGSFLLNFEGKFYLIGKRIEGV